MMLSAGVLQREFMRRSNAAFLNTQRHTQMMRDERERRERRAEDREQAEEDFGDLAAITMLTSTEVATFRAELDTYETATVVALQENEQRLESAQKRLDELLMRAYVLPDGRRVFKTQDGTRVFDETGAEVSPSVVAPDQIGDQHPRWEEYNPRRAEVNRLEAERQAILQYQLRLDEARERLNSGNMTREEYDRLRGELRTEMPEAVRRHVPGMEDERDPALASEAEPKPVTASAALDISEDMVPTSSAPAASAALGMPFGPR